MSIDQLDEVGRSDHPGPVLPDGAVRLRTGLHILPHGADEIFVRAGSRAAFSKVIKDPGRRQLLARIVQEATEPVSTDDLAATLGASAPDVADLLKQLLDAEVITTVARDQAGRTVQVIGDGRLARYLTADLSEIDKVAGAVRVGADAWRESDVAELTGDLVVVATDHLHPALNHEVNAAAHDSGTPVLFCHIDGTELVVGPLVLPGESACYLCFDVQDEGARHLRDEFLIYKDALDRAQPETEAEPASAMLAAAWTALAVARFDPETADFLVGRVLRVETSRMEVMTHRVLQIPRCPVCANVRPDLEHTFL